MPTEKKKIAAYLSDDVGRKFDEFKQVRGIKGDSQALNQLLAEYFGVTDSLSPPPSLLSRVEALELSLMRSFRGQDVAEEIFSDKTWLSEEEVANLIQIPVDRLRRKRGSLSLKDFNKWLLKTSKDYKTPIVYSLNGYSFFELELDS